MADPCHEPSGEATGLLGWIVLGRAFDKLRVLEQGWLAKERARDPIDD
jgi:hypothetical protein